MKILSVGGNRDVEIEMFDVMPPHMYVSAALTAWPLHLCLHLCIAPHAAQPTVPALSTSECAGCDEMFDVEIEYFDRD